MKHPREGRSGNYFQMKGRKAEQALYDLAQRSFLTDWCYPNPRWPDGTELCDLLVVFDHTAIIWQLKDLQADASGGVNPSELQKNLRQLTGAGRHLFDLKKPIQLANPRRGPEAFDPSTITEVFLVSAVFGPMGEGFAFVEELKEKTIHVMPRSFVEVAVGELDTIADFTDYLRAKEALFRSAGSMIVLGGEEELLGHYLFSGRSFDDLKEYDQIVLENGFWEKLQKDPRYIAKKREDHISYGWDEIISRAHEGSPAYERVARELARPNRFNRRYLAKCFYEGHVKAHEEAHGNVYRRVLPMDGVTYVFVYQDDRQRPVDRREHLYRTCLVARMKYPKNAKLVGIATEMKFRRTCSYDYCVLYMPTLADDVKKEIEELQADNNILTNLTVEYKHEDEYPDVR